MGRDLSDEVRRIKRAFPAKDSRRALLEALATQVEALEERLEAATRFAFAGLSYVAVEYSAGRDAWVLEDECGDEFEAFASDALDAAIAEAKRLARPEGSP